MSPIENLLIAVNCVLPAFLIICAGALVRRAGIIPEETFPQLSSLAFHALLPCLLFHSIFTTDIGEAFHPPLILCLVLFVLGWFLLSFFLLRKLVPNHRTQGAFIQAAFRSNIAIVGVSMADAMMGSAGVAGMSIAMAFLVPLYNILAVITLETCRGGTIQLRPTLLGILKNPLILSSGLGVLFLLAKIPIPGSVLTAIDRLGDAGSVMAMFALGAGLRLQGLRDNRNKLIAANFLRLIIAPAAGLTVAILCGFRGNDLGVALLCLAPSLATTAHPMAIVRDSDHELTGQIVVTSSFFCCITLFLWIFILKQIGLL